MEQLEEIQKEMDYDVILRTVKDCKTRWNSTYYSWERLSQLKDAIVNLPDKLKLSRDSENKKKSSELKRIMLSEQEWLFLEEMLDLFCGFEELTNKLSGSNYVTISLVYPSICTLKDDLLSCINFRNLEETELDLRLENLIDDVIEEIPADMIKIDKKRKTLNISNPPNLEGLQLQVEIALYNALEKYWSAPDEICLISSFLDPRFKNLHFVDSNIREQTINAVKELYQAKKSPDKTNIIDEPPRWQNSNEKKRKSIFDSMYINDNEVDSDDDKDELSDYLIKKEVRSSINPLNWWEDKKVEYPILSSLRFRTNRIESNRILK